MSLGTDVLAPLKEKFYAICEYFNLTPAFSRGSSLMPWLFHMLHLMKE